MKPRNVIEYINKSWELLILDKTLEDLIKEREKELKQLKELKDYRDNGAD